MSVAARVAFLDLSRHVASVREELEAAVAEVLDGGRFLYGPPVERFERDFADYCGVEHAVGVANGTDAIELALRALGIGAGDEVVAPANTCVPTIAGIEAAGATPVLADAEAATLTLDPGALDAACSDRTRAAVAVHLYGQCADMAAIAEVAGARGLKVVEDAAQAHGAEYRGSRAGSLGDAAAFSFYPTKNLGALGDGGAVATDDPEVAARVRMLQNYGERERYASEERGTNSRLDTLQAAVLSAKLAHLDEWTERRRELAALYLDGLADTGLALPAEARGRRHAYHLFVVRAADRERFRSALAAAGVDTLVHYPRPIHGHPAYGHLARHLPVSERACAEVVSLPLYPELTDAEAERVVTAVCRAAR